MQREAKPRPSEFPEIFAVTGNSGPSTGRFLQSNKRNDADSLEKWVTEACEGAKPKSSRAKFPLRFLCERNT
jgi:hypothetical protein